MLARFLCLILLTALFLPHTGEAHAHLCLDGAGPAVSMHMPESGEQCTHVDAAGHHDHSVEMESPAIGKLWPPGLDAAVFAVVLVLFLLARQARFLNVAPDWQASASSLLFLRPPLRGPPA